MAAHNRDEPDFAALEPELRDLAARLVADPEWAEDALQETFVAALTGVPDLDRGWSGWMRRILRSKARQIQRNGPRLVSLSEALADPVTEDGAAQEREDLAMLHEEIARLREPYRSTLHARFYEGLAPRHIANRDGVPVRTVATRLVRGLALLREAFERHGGSSERGIFSWLPGSGLRWRSLRRWAMIAAAGGAALVTWQLFVVSREPVRGEMIAGFRDRAPSEEASPEPARFAIPSSSQPSQTATESVRLESRGPQVAREGDEAGAAVLLRGLRGRVLDAREQPVAGLEVVFEPGRIEPISPVDLRVRFLRDGGVSATDRSAQDGSFLLRVGEDARGRVLVRDKSYVTILSELFQGHEDGTPLEVVVARAIELSGFVFDAAGGALASAHVDLRPPPSVLERMAGSPRSWMPVAYEVMSGQDGRFELERAPVLEGSRLAVSASGFKERMVEVQRGQRARIVLVPEVPQERGLLRLATGEPVSRGRIAIGGRVVHTDEKGRFSLDWPECVEGAQVWGFAPGRLAARGLLRAGSSLELVVGDAALAIEGRVVDAFGVGVPGAVVWTVDPTPLGVGLRGFFAETHMNIDPQATVPFRVLADEDGRFRLPFLLERDYQLAALEPRTFHVTESEAISAGSRNLVLRLPTSIPCRPILGRVLDRFARPVPGASVVMARTAVRVRDQDGRTLESAFHGPSSRTDEGGFFALSEVPDQPLFLDIAAEGFFPTVHRMVPGADRAHVEILVARRVPLCVSWSEGSETLTHFVVRDADGELLDLDPVAELDRSYGWIPRARMPLQHGEEHRVLVPDTASTVVLFDGVREVRRVALEWNGVAGLRIEI